MKNTKITTEKYSLANRGFSRIKDHGNYLLGEVVTPHGVVIAYSQGYSDGDFKYSRLDLSHKGTHYMRNIDRSYSSQYLVTLAKRFAKEICK